MTKRASGEFEVKVEPIAGDSQFPRLSLTKTFHGDLDGSSTGVMMSVEGTEKGSGAYVAIERVTAILHGKKGSFALIHNGTMRRGGDFRMEVKVVPDSGTDQFTGLTGTMEIVVEHGKHSYNFDYVLPQ